MEIVPSNWRDADKYYRGTYVKFKEHGEKLFFIDVVTETEIHGKDEDDNTFILYLDEDAPYTLDYILPSRAVFNYKSTAYMLQRVPARQYQRGLSAGNTRVIEIPSGARRDFNFQMLKAFVNKQNYPTLKDAIFGKAKEKVLAVSSRMSFGRESRVLYVDCTPVGEFNRETNTFRINTMFNPELKELIAKNPWSVEIVNV